MASLSDILRGALSPNEYNMGRDLDEEERRQIEELRAQGIHVPQERKVSPFRYGAGAVRQQNLAIRSGTGRTTCKLHANFGKQTSCKHRACSLA